MKKIKRKYWNEVEKRCALRKREKKKKENNEKEKQEKIWRK